MKSLTVTAKISTKTVLSVQVNVEIPDWTPGKTDDEAEITTAVQIAVEDYLRERQNRVWVRLTEDLSAAKFRSKDWYNPKLKAGLIGYEVGCYNEWSCKLPGRFVGVCFPSIGITLDIMRKGLERI